MARTTPGTDIPVPDSSDPRTITADLWASFSKVGTLITQTSGESSAALTTSESAEAKAAQAVAIAAAIEDPIQVGGDKPAPGTKKLWVDESDNPDPTPVGVAWDGVAEKPDSFPSTIPDVAGLEDALAARALASHPALYNSGPRNMSGSLLTGWTAAARGVSLQRQGPNVTYVLDVTAVNQTGTSEVIPIPAGFRPVVPAYLGKFRSGSVEGWFDVNNNNLRIRDLTGGLPAGSRITIMLTWTTVDPTPTTLPGA